MKECQHNKEKAPMQTWSNWSGSVVCTPRTIERPVSEAELIALMRADHREIRVVGTGHSFLPLCATNGLLLSLDGLQGVLATDAQTMQTTIWAGTKISQIGAPLLAAGMALENQADVDTQALAGAIATGTHGTGPRFGNLSSRVTALRLVLATGEVLTCSETVERDIFKAAQVSLGLLGVVSQITMQVIPAYRLHERTWAISVEACLAQLDSLIRAHRHFEFLWLPTHDLCVAKTLNVSQQEPSGGQPAQLAPPGSLERYTLPERIDWSYRVFPSKRTVLFNEMEFAVPFERGPECFREIRSLMLKKHRDITWDVEYRTLAADGIYLSPASGRDAVAISLHQSHDLSYRAFFADAEAIFRNHGGRPHWAKIHTHSARELRALYPMWQQFQEVRRRLDPAGRFMNEYLRGLMLE
jgi:FAD/FMN-containing dehydrogenase